MTVPGFPLVCFFFFIFLAVRHISSCCFRLIYLISESSNQCAWFGIRVRVCMCQARAIPTTRIRAFARGRRLCHFC